MKISFVVGKEYQNNKAFDIQDTFLNRDNCLYFLYHLKQYLEQLGHVVATHDLQPLNQSDLGIFIDMPNFKLEKNKNRRDFLIIFESEIIRPDNWDLSKQVLFDKIFTWNDDFVDNEKFFKINFSFPFLNVRRSAKAKLLTLVAANKKCNHPKELYSKRVEAINWFSNNAPEDFDYYGFGWDKYLLTNNKIIQKISYKYLHNLLGLKKPKCYMGSIAKKYDTLQLYKFAICYENAEGITGYVTEKIFDCFFSGVIPIYRGASNIHKVIDSETFIEATHFTNYEELYRYLKNFSENEYSSKINKIEKYLKSEKAQLFSCQYFTETIIGQI